MTSVLKESLTVSMTSEDFFAPNLFTHQVKIPKRRVERSLVKTMAVVSETNLTAVIPDGVNHIFSQHCYVVL